MKNQSLAALFRTLAASLSTPRRGISLASRPSALVLAGSIAALLSAEPAQATLLYWDLNGATANTAAAVTGAWNGTNAFWNTASTGTGGTAQAGTTNADDLFFFSGTLYTTGTVTASSSRVASSINFQTNIVTTLAGPLAIGGTGTKSGIFVLSGENSNSTVSGAITLATAASTFQNAGTGTLAITGGVTGAQNLTLQNNGATANGITISGGSLNNTGTVINSGTGASQSAGVLISAAIGANVTSLTQNSATSFLRLSGTNLYTGNTIVTAGALTYLTTNTKSSTLTTVAANATLGLGVSGANAFAQAS